MRKRIIESSTADSIRFHSTFLPLLILSTRVSTPLLLLRPHRKHTVPLLPNYLTEAGSLRRGETRHWSGRILLFRSNRIRPRAPYVAILCSTSILAAARRVDSPQEAILAEHAVPTNAAVLTPLTHTHPAAISQGLDKCAPNQN
ncbi:hypothetical protein B0H12DRAFT_1230830 [Mycena haematopus]|nr:hypothetical protein B0H12DRAFT_1230830 [Mycena haematopus]